VSKQNKQNITYKPQIKYTDNYHTKGGFTSESNTTVKKKNNRQPLDAQTIPQIGENIQYLDSALKALPKDLQSALREIYDPVKDIYYETLIDKIVDPNLNPEKIEIKVPDPNPDPPPEPDDPEPEDPEEKKIVRPIVLRPVKTKKDPEKPGEEDPDPPIEDKSVKPIELRPLPKENDDPGDWQPIQVPSPIVLLPLTDYDNDKIKPGPPGPPDDDDDDDDDPEMWDPPDVDIIYKDPEIRKQIDKEFIYLLTKIAQYYTEKLKDLINNYIYNILRNNIDMDDEKLDFVHSKLVISSNDILNHSKHLLDIAVKDEDMSKLKIDFLKNNFNFKYSTAHIRSFYVSNELRCRYTDISYSSGKSMTNAMSDALLKQMHAKYELQYRNDFENLFRYINSSLKVTSDIIGTLIEKNISKSTLAKKNGRRKK
jgi:hypothetical protein